LQKDKENESSYFDSTNDAEDRQQQRLSLAEEEAHYYEVRGRVTAAAVNGAVKIRVLEGHVGEILVVSIDQAITNVMTGRSELVTTAIAS
jgi:hypothetical protein